MTTPADIIADLAKYQDETLYNELIRRDAVRCDSELNAARNPDTDEWITVEVHPEVVYLALVQRDAAGYTIVPKAERPSVCPTCGSDDRDVCGWDFYRDHLTVCPDAWHGEGR